MTGSNLLLSCWGLTSRKEDLLTEFLAAALRADAVFASRFTSLLLATDIQDPPGSSETQVDSPSGCPDMRLQLTDGQTILVENKLDAAETLRWSSEDDEPEPQLERYLTETVNGVAYIRADWKPPKAEVLVHPHYLSPQDRPHSLWRDPYPLLISCENTLSVWLREAFEVFGFTPPLPGVGDLQSPGRAARLDIAAHTLYRWVKVARPSKTEAQADELLASSARI